MRRGLRVIALKHAEPRAQGRRLRPAAKAAGQRRMLVCSTMSFTASSWSFHCLRLRQSWSVSFQLLSGDLARGRRGQALDALDEHAAVPAPVEDRHLNRPRIEIGRRVRGRHPLQKSDAPGAASTQLGPQAHLTTKAAALLALLGLDPAQTVEGGGFVGNSESSVIARSSRPWQVPARVTALRTAVTVHDWAGARISVAVRGTCWCGRKPRPDEALHSQSTHVVILRGRTIRPYRPVYGWRSGPAQCPVDCGGPRRRAHA